MQFLKALTIAVSVLLGGHALADPPRTKFPAQDQAEALLKAADAEKHLTAKRELLRQFMAKHDDTRYGDSNEEYNYYAGNAVGLFLQTAANEAEYLTLSKELTEQSASPRARAFALKALGERYESQGNFAAAKEVYQRLSGPDGEHEIIWNESFSGYAKEKLRVASPEGIAAAKAAAERAAAWEKERANRIPPSIYNGPGTDPGPKEDLYRFALISAAVLIVIVIYAAVRIRKNRGVS